MANIVILDAYTTNPGDLSWECFERFGDLTVYDRTPPEQVNERAGNADIILTNKVLITEKNLEKLPRLKYVGLLSTGVNVVDLEGCRKRGIPVTNIPSYSTQTVAQMVFSMITALCFHTEKYSDSVHKGEWERSIDFTYQIAPLVELEGKTLGIIGFGNIGRKVAQIGRAFGMRIIAAGRRPLTPDSEYENKSIKEVFQEADILTLHCPLNEESARMVNAETLALMKPQAFLVNTARGGLVDESALAEALNNGVIAGAALDVLSTEPPKSDNPLLKARNCIITPHIAWASKEARARLISIAYRNIDAFLQGNILNVVN